MRSCLRAKQYKVGMVLSMTPDRWRSPIVKMLNSKVTFFCFLLAFTHVFGEYNSDTVPNKNKMPIFCYINGTDLILNSIENSELDAKLCSYILIRGTVNEENWTVRLARPNWEETISNDMDKLKSSNNNLKFIITISQLFGQSRYFPLLAFKHYREFAANAKLFIRKYKFDGIHINWWYPNIYSPVYSEDDDDDDDDSYTLKSVSLNDVEDDSYEYQDRDTKELDDDYDEDDEDDDIQISDFQSSNLKYFVRLIKELKSQLDENRSLIAVSVGAKVKRCNLKYMFDNLKSIVDYWIIMAMGYNARYKFKVFPLAPIRTNDPVLGMKATVDLVKKTIGPDDFNKIVLAIPFVALAYKLRHPLNENQSPFENDVRGRLGKKPAFTYGAMCILLKNMKQNNTVWSYTYNTTAEIPYLIKNKFVVLYEDPRSIGAKTSLAINEGLGGIMTYNVDSDDCKGICNENVKCALLKTVHDTIQSLSPEAWKTYQMNL